MWLGSHCATWPYAYEISSVDAIKGRRISMNLCLNAFVIQFPDDLLDTCLVTAPRALLLPFAHRGHCKDEDSYKECSSHVEFSIGLTRKSSATAGGAELCFHFIVHNSSFSFSERRPAVGCSDLLGLYL